ncbi:DNA polymerase III subunit alpha [Candidatus Peregrinibacteria bacterium]|nr:MAG: DNA polymerase III subunit alpha [Candidatus Peregrinibacteria bacterium]
MSFVHLHNHTHYSILTGLAKPKDYVKLAKEQGSPAVALTDSGVFYGALEFYKAAKAEGIKPILGVEAYVAPLGRHLKTPENRYSSLVLLARNNEGYQNLLKLCSVAALEGFYYKPRIDEEVLEKYSSGLIALTGSLGGLIPKLILENQMDVAREKIKKYQEIFGKEFFYLELQHHPEIANWSIVNSKLIELSKETGAPLVAANDCHYLKPEDAEAHDVLICIQNQKTVKDEHRFRYNGNFSMRSPEDMKESFRFCPEAYENTLKIAEMCTVDIKFGEHLIPYFDTGSETPEAYLRQLCEKGFKERYGDSPPEGALERLDFELETIHKMGFDAYFLIVHDFIRYAKENGIVVGPGRGSAAGSIISYCLKITELDPLQYKLLFERFLNPERISMPDIDVDFDDLRRDEVLKYVTEKYGEDHVAQIITFGTLAPKAAIRDAGRALGFSYSEVDRVAKMVPPAILGKYAPLEESLTDDPELSKLYKEDEHAKEILDTAVKLEGTIRQVGTHACAVIISRDPLDLYTPLQKATGDGEGIVTQYSMKPCEELGLLKMDFLGLSNLTILQTTLGVLKRTRPELTVDLAGLPMDDKKAYELLQRGETTGVFQMESAGMKRYLRELKPTEFTDIIAMVSLYRPGPMQFISSYIDGKHGKKKVTYLHESLEAVLKETYGIAIYQEQILEIAKVFAGFSLGEADLLRRAIGKKIASELVAQREKFIQGAVAQGREAKLASKIFDEVVEPFAGYGFNKSHAACYAYIAYQTAYLKAHYPAEFMAALLTSDADNTDRIVIEIEECRNMGIEVLPPSVNESRAHFTVIDDKTIRFGLMAIKGMGDGPVYEIIRVREEGGPFSSLEDLARRVPAKILNKKTIECLAYSGAMDELGERAQLASNYDEINTYAKNIQASSAEGQTDIFGMMDDSSIEPLHMREVPPADSAQRFRWEKDFVGLYVSGHPLQGMKRYFQSKGKLIGSLTEKEVDKKIQLTGFVTQVRKIMTKAGKYMAMGEIEDPTARVPFVLFPRAYDAFGQELAEERVYTMEGRLDKRGEDFQFILDSLKTLSLENMIKSAKEKQVFDAEDRIIGVPPLRSENAVEESEVSEVTEGLENAAPVEIRNEPFIVSLNEGSSPELLKKLKTLLEENKGETVVEIHIPNGQTLKRIKVPFGVDVHPLLQEEVKKILQ